ncbi:hypothetical protein QSJ19_14340 [Gordonia sp. ABSL11-1]|uniref:hypothetical protein n=1 Tax=Gordonia sp. ABSL11-1 TaxID=3053924 RepID=UPI002573151D|nr:hypothetical protein [Gordonia sp. ABSL11-1]MDL9946748.1 hypothetical protein [Gordonia sp. ABSL11-1]
MGENINPDYEEASNNQILDELRQINENLNGLYTLLHDNIVLPIDSNHAKLMKQLDKIEDRLGSIEGNTM